MNVKSVTGNYDEQNYRFNIRRLRKKSRFNEPIDSVIFEKHDSNEKDPEINEQKVLLEIIKQIPDEVVSEKIEKQMKAYDSVEDALVDKLIMEEL